MFYFKLLRHFYLSAFITLTFFIQANPQPKNIKFDQIGLEQGLSQSSVYAITQDAFGFMWFGTDDGLNRYDGYSISIFKHNPNDSNTISDNTILSLLSDKKGDLWI
ncbi:MAG: two-component regulator propeller domain-containing protein, partial [Ignavibacteriaceae bacterium]|nr:two-component regulator propeller domain-containing protein [Ignavibacteriaceae bacterium]